MRPRRSARSYSRISRLFQAPEPTDYAISPILSATHCGLPFQPLEILEPTHYTLKAKFSYTSCSRPTRPHHVAKTQGECMQPKHSATQRNTAGKEHHSAEKFDYIKIFVGKYSSPCLVQHSTTTFSGSLVKEKIEQPGDY